MAVQEKGRGKYTYGDYGQVFVFQRYATVSFYVWMSCTKLQGNLGLALNPSITSSLTRERSRTREGLASSSKSLAPIHNIEN